MSLHVLAYNLKRVMTILAVQPLKQVNKGPFLFDAIDELHELLQRIEERRRKKTQQLRRLKNW